MKNEFGVYSATEKETDYIENMIRDYKRDNLSLGNRKNQILCKVIKNSEGNIIAGISGQIMHDISTLDVWVLWVKEEMRHCGYGTVLLQCMEKEAFKEGIHLVCLGTLGFQAQGFYEKKGYRAFAVLDEAVLNNKVYFMNKILHEDTSTFTCAERIENGANEDMHELDDNIVSFNSQKVPFTNEPAFEDVNRIIRDSNGNIAAGICASIRPWKDMEIIGLWAKENSGMDVEKKKLLNEVENELKMRGGHVVFLDTFDFKMVEFMTSNGYEVYGTLDDYPMGYKAYYLKKILQ